MTEVAQPQAASHRYFDGASARAWDVEMRVGSSSIEIIDRAQQRVTHWPIHEVRVVDRNAVNGALTLRLEPDSHARLHVAKGVDQDHLLSQHPQLAKWRSRAHWSLAKGFAIWGSVGIALSVAAYLGWASAAIWLAAWMPEEYEQRLGDVVQSAFVHKDEVCSGEDGQRALDRLVERLKSDALKDKSITLMVITQGQPNAFAIPGRRIVMFSGLIKRANNPEMLAGVLAHEMAHAELRHPVRGVIHNLGLGAVLSLIFGDSSLASVGQVALALSYTRDLEREADARAISMLQEAGIRADGLNAFFRDLQKDKEPVLPNFLATHPDLTSRIEATRQPPKGAPAMTAVEWQAVKKMCGS